MTKGRWITLSSGRGARGKTWLTAGLGACLADRGQRCLLVDGDWGFSNLVEQLGLEDRVGLDMAGRGEVLPSQVVQPFRGGAGQGGFDVAAASSGGGSGLLDGSTKELRQLCRMLRWFTSEYDFVLFDRQTYLSDGMIRLATAADRVIIAISDEPTSMTDGYAHIRHTRAMKPSAQVSLLVNNVETAELGANCELAMQRACRAYIGFDLDSVGVVVHDDRAGEARKTHTPFPWLYPDSAAALALGEVADRLIAGAVTD